MGWMNRGTEDIRSGTETSANGREVEESSETMKEHLKTSVVISKLPKYLKNKMTKDVFELRFS